MSERATNGMLLMGIAAGALLATLSLQQPGGGDAPVLAETDVAIVGGRTIDAQELTRTVERVAGELRAATTPAGLEERVLDRLIDEELLVQYGIQLGLAARDPQIRTLLGAGVVDLILARAEAGSQPDAATLRAYWRAHPQRFATTGRIRVTHQAFGDRHARRPVAWPAVPQTAMAPKTLRQYLPATVVAVAQNLPPGVRSEALEAGGAWHVVEVVERVSRPAPFDAALVRAELQRDAGDAALRDFLRQRRETTRLVRR